MEYDKSHTPISSEYQRPNLQEYLKQNSNFSSVPLGASIIADSKQYNKKGKFNKQKKEKKYRTIKKKVFFQGTQHELSEKESIDSDEVMTSEDEFQVDDLVITQYNKRQ